MTSSTALRPTVASDHARDTAAPPPSGSAHSAQGTFAGLNWTYQPNAEELLATLPPAAWSNPAAQGWQRVKHNARREVWRATILGRGYYLKYYFCGWWRRVLTNLVRLPACQDEYEGGLFAQHAGVPAVRPVAYTHDLIRNHRRCALLITAAVEPVRPLSDFWQELQSDSDTARRRDDTTQLIELLAQMIARSHQAGLEHLDMHAANILVQPIGPRQYRTLFVDLHSARRGVPLNARAVVRNLAQLNQWFHKHSTIGDRLRFLRAYLRWRNEFEHVFEHARALPLDFAELARALTAGARHHAQRLGNQRDHRIHRDGRYFTRLKLGDGWRGYAISRCKHATPDSRASHMIFERQWWQQTLQNPLAWFAEPNTNLSTCKDSHSATVSRALLDHANEPLPVILKRPRARNLRRRLIQLLPPSRSLRAWRLGHALLHRDIPTARPLAVLERRLGPLVLDSLILTEALPGAADLETHLRKLYPTCTPRQWATIKRTLTDRAAMLVRRLTERGFDHRDCKATNILVLEHPATKLLWIDLDGIRPARHLSRHRQLRPLINLHVSLLPVPGLSRTDRVRFLKRYLAHFGTPSDEWRRVWRTLEPLIERKLHTKQRRRDWKLRRYGRE